MPGQMNLLPNTSISEHSQLKVSGYKEDSVEEKGTDGNALLHGGAVFVIHQRYPYGTMW